MNSMNCIVIHYSEIGIKGKNRERFERKLMRNIKDALKANGIRTKAYRRYGRIICKPINEFESAKKVLKLVPGIAYFSFAVKTELNFNEIARAALALLKNKKFKSFKVKSRRSYKQFPLTSMEIDRKLGELILEKLRKKVNVKTPDITLYVEICEKEAFLYCERFKGIGGLPVNSSGKVLVLLSGGIDSPVASFLMMKRGCKVVFIHFYNESLVKSSKIERIVQQLTAVQGSSKLYMIPFGSIQNEIIKSVPSKFRMLVYRRFMLRIAEEIAKKEKAIAIATGDSIGQVASQTLENLNCIYQTSKLPVFAPLIGLNKEEVIDLAKSIGTYELSILPYPDCCSFMVSKHPATHADVEEVLRFEKSIKSELVKKSIACAKVKYI